MQPLSSSALSRPQSQLLPPPCPCQRTQDVEVDRLCVLLVNQEKDRDAVQNLDDSAALRFDLVDIVLRPGKNKFKIAQKISSIGNFVCERLWLEIGRLCLVRCNFHF